MAVSVRQFRQQIVQCGLLGEAELEEFESQLPQRPETAEALAKELVRAGKLTKFQAQSLYNGKGSSLVLGNYFIQDKLGAGGMGQVFRAEHRRMKRIVALKVLPAEMVKDSNNVQRFHREVQAAARLNHPHIVTAYDADETKGVHYLVMENVDGVDLSTLVRRDGPLTAERAIHVLTQAARGLQYAHEHGVIHRDIKPSNILLDRQGVVKILDMGLARFDDGADAQAQAALTHTGTVMGTIDYMSPEQALDTKHADARSDMYSLGCTLWFLLTGQPVFAGDTLMKKLLAHRETPIPSLAQHPQVAAHAECSPAALAAIDRVFQKMLAKDPAARYRSMEEVIAALQGCLVNAESQTVSVGSSADALSPASGAAFFTSADDSSAPTLAADAASFLPGTAPVETLPSGFLDQTLTSGLSRYRRRPRSSTSPWAGFARWAQEHYRTTIGVAAAGVLGLLLAVSLFRSAGRRVVVVDEGPADLNHRPNVAATTPPDDDSNVAVVTEVSPPSGQIQPTVLSFDGDGDYVHVPTIPYEDPAEGVTVEMWARPRWASDGANLVSWMGPHWISLFQSNTNWGVGRLGNNNAAELQFSNSPLAVGEWTHLAGVYKRERMQLFVNGRLVQTSSSPLELEPTEGGLYIGGAPEAALRHDGERWFVGDIHSLRLSSGLRYKQAFTPSQSLAADETTLALYRFDEGSGASIADLSGNGHDGTIHGATWSAPAAATSRQPEAADGAGPASTGLTFDGDDIVTFPGLGLPVDEPRTVELWLTPRSRPVPGEPKPRALGFDFIGLRYTHDGARWEVTAESSDDPGYRIFLSDAEVAWSRRTHLAVTWLGDELVWYVNGRRQTQRDRLNPRGRASDPATIGAWLNQDAGFIGDIHALRLSRGVRYASDFSPDEQWQPDEQTLALYDFADGGGDVLRDVSGNGRHGAIAGATWIPASSQDRAVAEWVLSVGGDVEYYFAPDHTTIAQAGDVEDLPPGDFQLRYVWIRSNSDVNDDDFARFDSLPYLFGIRCIELPNCSGELIARLGDLSGLVHLELSRFPVDDEQLAALGRFPALSELGLVNTNVTDDGLRRLASLTELRQLYLQGTQVTAAGVALLRESLPQCTVYTDFGEFAAVVDSRELTVARWVLDEGGVLEGDLFENSAWSPHEFDPGNPPAGPFVVRDIDLSGADAAPAELQQLVGLAGLNSVKLDAAFAAEGLPVIARQPLLEELGWTRPTSELSGLSQLPLLTLLAVSANNIDDQFAFVGELPHLRRIAVWCSRQQLPDIGPLGAYPQLRQLELTDCDSLPDESVVAQLQQQNPQLRILLRSSQGAAERTLGADPHTAAALRLFQYGVQLDGMQAGRWTASINPADPGGDVPVWAGHVTIPSEVDLAAGERDELAALVATLELINLTGCRDADDYAARLRDCRALNRIRFDWSDLTDRGLAELETLTGLSSLDVRSTTVTAAGVDRFARAVPNCAVISDFGRVAPRIELPPAFVRTSAASGEAGADSVPD